MTKTLAIVGGSLSALVLMGAGEDTTPLYPVITEVLFNVPPGEAGDANKDGSRDSTGDEFVEIFNATGKAMDLKGYTITSRLSTGDSDPKRGVRFTFPKFELPPGGVAVVFNGYKASIPGPTGSSERAPSGASKEFGGAYVFSMGIKQPMLALKNDGDFVLLSDAAGKAVACVSWGSPDPEPPSEVVRGDVVSGGMRCSVQRAKVADDLVAHTSIDGRTFSPGEMPSTEEKPAESAESPEPADGASPKKSAERPSTSKPGKQAEKPVPPEKPLTGGPR